MFLSTEYNVKFGDKVIKFLPKCPFSLPNLIGCYLDYCGQSNIPIPEMLDLVIMQKYENLDRFNRLIWNFDHLKQMHQKNLAEEKAELIKVENDTVEYINPPKPFGSYERKPIEPIKVSNQLSFNLETFLDNF